MLQNGTDADTMTKKRSTSKPTTPLSLLRGAVGLKKSGKLLSHALEEFKTKGLIEMFPFVYVQAAHNPNFGNVITSGRMVRDLIQLGGARVLTSASLARELQWAAVGCFVSKPLITRFIELRADFFAKFSARNFSAAEGVLDEIDKCCGRSLWAVENRICLLSVAEGGFEAQKKFVTSITKACPRSNISFMAASIGERNEPRVSAKAFEQRLRHRSLSWNIDSSQMTHIFYRLCNVVDPSEAAYASVLAQEANYSCIDLYESLLAIARRVRRMPFYDDTATIAAVTYLDSIVDSRKTALLHYLIGNPNTILNVDIPPYHWLFQCAEYEKVIEETASALKADPWNIDAMVAHAKACTAADAQPVISEGLGSIVIPSLCAFFSGAADAEGAVDTLIKTANNFRHADFSVPLIILMKSRTYRWFYRLEEQCALIDIFVPVNVSFIERELAELNHQEKQSEGYKESCKLFDAITEGDAERAQQHAHRLTGSVNLYYRTLGKSFHANLLAKNLMIPEALELSVDALLDHPGLVEFTPLGEIIRDRGYRHLKQLSGSPALSVSFQLYIDNVDNADKDVSLKVSWKNYLSSKGYTKPSEFTAVNGYTKVEAYFLSHVCSQSTMELGGAFFSQLDLDRERVLICANLAAAFPLDVENFNQEIVDLTRRINIEEGVQLLESSRVYVDEIGIQKWAKKNLESQFLRYLDHLNVGLVDSVAKLEEDLRKIMDSPNADLTSLRNYLDDYDISADSLLEGIIRDLSLAFLQLPRFGLDSFLSSRVRHGSFVGYLRGPLESHHIVTKKQTVSTKYHDNEAMLDKWGISGERERRVVNAKLAALSEATDALLDEMVGKYLHVRSKSHPDGMVAFATEHGPVANAIKAWVVSLKTSLTQHTTLEALVTHSIENFLWPAVRISLDSVKTHVQIDLGHKFAALFDGFLHSIEGVTDKIQRERVSSDIAAVSTELGDALRRVALWFDLPQANTQLLLMPLDRVLEIGLTSTQSARPCFDPEVVWQIESKANIQVKGPSIGILNDFAFLIFANISKHAGFEDVDTPVRKVNVWIAMDEHEGAIRITVSNEINVGKSMSAIRERLAVADLRIANRDFDAIDKQREGTGLVRLAMYFDTTESDGSNFAYWLTEKDRRFHVQIQLPASMVRIIGG